MANAPLKNQALQQINSLSQLHIVRQLGFMALLAASIALGIAIVLWSTGSNFTPLYMDLSTQDSADVISALEQNGTQFKIESNSGAVLVPSEKVQQIRLQLANNGLPRATSRGYDMLEDDQSLGTSNFVEQARYNRALEQELVQTISHIQGVRDARVHLSIPKQTSFIRSSSKPTASVMIDLFHLQSLSESQLMGISHLVASSIAGLETENVSIVDQRGNLLSKSSTSEYGSSNENIRYTRNLEEEYSNRIIDILTPVVGSGRVRAKVAADLDFTYIETTAESFDPSTSVIRSEQTQQESLGPMDSIQPAETDQLSPNPPDTAQTQSTAASNNQTRSNSTRNFEIDRQVSLMRSVPGAIKHISVAVLVDLSPRQSATSAAESDEEPAVVPEFTALEQEKISRLTQLVKDAIGFNEARGDSVSIINEQFISDEVLIEPERMPVWQQAWVFQAVKIFLAGMVVLFLIFGVLRPAMKSVVISPGNPMGRNAALLSNSNTADISDDRVSLTGIVSSPSMALATMPARSAYDENLKLAQTLVQNEPARAARMIQNWLANE